MDTNQEKNPNQSSDREKTVTEASELLKSIEELVYSCEDSFEEAIRKTVKPFMIGYYREALFKITDEFHTNGGIPGLNDHVFFLTIQTYSRLLDIAEHVFLKDVYKKAV